MQVVYSSKFYITIVLGFSWDDRKTQEKLRKGFRGGQSRCIMVYVKMNNPCIGE